MASRPIFTQRERVGPEYPPPVSLRVRNILCPVGFSEFSRRALHYAASIARHFRARLFVQHTVHRVLEISQPDAGWQEAVQKAHSELDQVLTEARFRQLEMPEVTPLVNAGGIREQILSSLEKHDIDLLVMGTHGRKGLGRFLPGSLTERLVHEVLRPVLVLSRPEHDFVEPEEIEPVHLRTILLATDFSPVSDRALTYGLRWAAECSAKVIIFHSADKQPAGRKGLGDLLPEFSPHFEGQIAKAAAQLRAQMPQLGEATEISYEVRFGNAKEQILKVAEEKKPDLIVMGAKGLRAFAVLWGSTVSEVVRDGRFPVLVVRKFD